MPGSEQITTLRLRIAFLLVLAVFSLACRDAPPTNAAFPRDAGQTTDANGCSSDAATPHNAGTGPEDFQTFRDGSRLRAAHVRAGDAPPYARWFNDTELGMDCRFAGTVDGSLRCVPIDFAEILYPDSDCTGTPLLDVDSYTGVWQAVAMETCGEAPAVRVFRVGSGVAAPVYRLKDGRCRASQGYRVRAIAEEVPAAGITPTNFVIPG